MCSECVTACLCVIMCPLDLHRYVSGRVDVSIPSYYGVFHCTQCIRYILAHFRLEVLSLVKFGARTYHPHTFGRWAVGHSNSRHGGDSRLSSRKLSASSTHARTHQPTKPANQPAVSQLASPPEPARCVRPALLALAVSPSIYRRYTDTSALACYLLRREHSG